MHFARPVLFNNKTQHFGLKEFLHSRKVPGCDSPGCPCRRGMQPGKHLLVECRLHTRKRDMIWEEDRRKVAFGRICWEEMLTDPKFARQAAQFMKSLGLVDQFRSVTIE